MTQRKVWYGGAGRPMYTNLFMLLIGEPGAGKSRTFDIGTEVLRALEKQSDIISAGVRFNFRLTQVTPAAMIAKMAKSKQALPGFNGYKEVTQSPIYIYADEVGTFLKDLGGGDTIQELLKLFDCPFEFHKETRQYGEERVEYPYLSLCGGTTPDYFSRFMNSEATGQGLSARFIFVTVPAQEEPRFNYNAPLDPTLFEQVIHAGRRVALCKGYLNDGEGVAAFAEELIDRYQDARKVTPFGYKKHYFSRKFMTVKKVAGLLSLSESSSRVVELRHYERAILMLDELEPYFETIYAMTDIARVEGAPEAIVHYIPYDRPLTVEGVVTNAAQHGVNILLGSAELAAVFSMLTRAGRLHVGKLPSGEPTFQRVK